jgi:hypothetical protein
MLLAAAAVCRHPSVLLAAAVSEADSDCDSLNSEEKKLLAEKEARREQRALNRAFKQNERLKLFAREVLAQLGDLGGGAKIEYLGYGLGKDT